MVITTMYGTAVVDGCGYAQKCSSGWVWLIMSVATMYMFVPALFIVALVSSNLTLYCISKSASQVRASNSAHLTKRQNLLSLLKIDGFVTALLSHLLDRMAASACSLLLAQSCAMEVVQVQCCSNAGQFLAQLFHDIHPQMLMIVKISDFPLLYAPSPPNLLRLSSPEKAASACIRIFCNNHSFWSHCITISKTGAWIIFAPTQHASCKTRLLFIVHMGNFACYTVEYCSWRLLPVMHSWYTFIMFWKNKIVFVCWVWHTVITTSFLLCV